MFRWARHTGLSEAVEVEEEGCRLTSREAVEDFPRS